MTVPFTDLNRQNQPYKDDILEVIEKVIDSGDYIMGSAVRRFEENFARSLQTRYAVGVNSGADAVYLTLHGLGLQPGDEVICPAYGFIEAVDAIPRVGANIVFADVDENYNLDVEAVRAAITERTRAVLVLHLFGRAAEIMGLQQLCNDHGLHLIEETSHACGASVGGKPLGTFGIAGIFSFYPTRNLGGLGDGGAIVTENEELTNRLRLYRNHGRDEEGVAVDLGISSRLNSIQAAVLDVKLQSLGEDNADRIANASFYHESLNGEVFQLPAAAAEESHVYNLYTIRHSQRDHLRNFLKERLVETRVYYPRPLHLEPCFEFLGYQEGHFPMAEQLSREALSLPISPGLTRKEMDEVSHAMGLFAQTFHAPTPGN